MTSETQQQTKKTQREYRLSTVFTIRMKLARVAYTKINTVW